MKLLIRKIRSLWQRDAIARKLFVQALLLLPWVALGLKLLGLQRTQRFMGRLFPKAAEPPNPEECRAVILTTVRQVRGAVLYCQPWANCLKKSLVLWALLRHQGIDSELRIGIRRDGGPFEAHAWIEYQGYVLNDSSDVHQRFAMFDQAIKADPLLKSE